MITFFNQKSNRIGSTAGGLCKKSRANLKNRGHDWRFFMLSFEKTFRKKGKEFLEKHGISVSFETLTDVIINREGTGMCPVERKVLDIDDVEQSFRLLVKNSTKCNKSIKMKQTESGLLYFYDLY